MPFATLDRIRHFYRLEGNQSLPVLVLSHSISTDHGMWQPQVQDLLPHFRILRYDTRGHGASDAPAGEYSVEQLGQDVLALVDALHISQFAFCGLSLGGAVGQWLAVHAPDRLTALVLANASPRYLTPANWQTRMDSVKQGGMAALVDMAMQRLFSAKVLAQRDSFVESIRSVFLGTNPAGYIGCCAALRDFEGEQDLGRIKSATLVIAGDNDVSTPWAGNGEVLAQQISGARAIRLPAAHLSNLERPRSFNAALLDFLQPKQYVDTLEAGFAARREVLGNAYVDSAIANTNELTKDFQDLITRYAWGTIWARPALDYRTRRLLVLAMMAALSRLDEFRLHVAAGLAHGLEPCDIKEVLLQAAIYAGVPAANTAFHVVQEELEKMGANART
jgi:3-oxoadipate enol-lactonase/4-carboxymuconolactone decarboxylase